MFGRALLACALLGQVLGAPTDCTEYCGEQSSATGYATGPARSSYSSYAAKSSSSYDHRLQQRVGGRYGVNDQLQTSGRLENLDENNGNNAVGGLGLNLDRPGSWRDEKHYVTDDGKGQMSYRAGQTVTGNGYSKFAEHSYSYGSHDSHAPLANSQVLSTAEFNRELASMRSRIASFMGSFRVDADSVVNANQIADFRDRAIVISNQLNDVCNQVDAGSSMYQQMRQMQQQFQQDVDKLQLQMEQQLDYHTSSSQVYGSFHAYPSISSTSRPTYLQPLQQQQQPQQPAISEESVVKQRLLEEEITKVQSQVSSFYTNFGRVNIDAQYKEDLSGQADAIGRELAKLKLQALQSEQQRARVENLKVQFESYLSDIRARIHKLEDRQREEAARQLEIRMQEEKSHYEENLRSLKLEKQRIEEEAEAERLRREEAERVKKQQEELFRAQEEEAARREAEAAAARRRQQQQQQQQLEEERRARLEIEEEQQQKTMPQPESVQGAGKVEVTGSSSYEHTVNSWSSAGGRHSSGAFQSSIGGAGGAGISSRPTQQQQQQQQQMNAHVDLIAATSRLQQDLHRIQNEIDDFNTHTMRLTAANSQSVINEANRQAESLRKKISKLCETSARYQNQNIQRSAENLSKNFEIMFRSLQNQTDNYLAESSGSGGFSASAGYASSSSYGSSGAYSSVQAPTITNVEYEHSKSAEVEVSRRPVSSSSSSQRYVQSSGQQRADCVEVYAGQPCVETRQQPRRYRRQAAEDEELDWTQQQQQQQHQPIFDANYQRSRNDNAKEEGGPEVSVGPQLGLLSFGPKSRDAETERRIEALARRVGSYGRHPVGDEGQRRELSEESRGQGFVSKHGGVAGLEKGQESSEEDSDEELDADAQKSGSSERASELNRSEPIGKAKHEGEHALGKSGFYDTPGYVRSESYGRNVQTLGGDGSWTAAGPGTQDSSGRPFRPQATSATHETLLLGVPHNDNRKVGSDGVETGKYVGSPRGQQPSHDILEIFDDAPGEESATEETVVDIRPDKSKPTPKPVPRYKWQVDHGSNESVNAESNVPSRNSDAQEKPSEPHRGDLPGYSEPSTPLVVEETPVTTEEPIAVVTPRPLPTVTPEPPTPVATERPKINQDDCDHQRPIVHYNFKLSHEKSIVNLNGNDRLSGVQKSNDEWQQKTSDLDGFSQSSQAFFNHQKYHHNYYYNQFNNKYQFNDQQIPQIWKPTRPIQLHYPMKPATELGAENNPTEFGHVPESFNKFHGYRNDFKTQEESQNLQPTPFEQSRQFQSSRQSNLGQVIQEPMLLPSSQWQDSLALENSGLNSKNRYTDSLTMANTLPPIHPWTEAEPTSTQRTFWKRVGHKLSYSYDKAKERARTIFG